jgi:hypothetical protein
VFACEMALYGEGDYVEDVVRPGLVRTPWR